jgi:hypothetical protein
MPGQKVALLPGGFKPPHKGHLAALRYLINSNSATAAIVFVGHKERYDITGEVAFTSDQSKQIWEVYSKYINVDFQIILPDNPVRAVYEHIKQHPNDFFYLGAGIEDQKRWSAINTSVDEFGELIYGNAEIVEIPDQFGRISGTVSRDGICDKVWDCLPIEVLTPEDIAKVKAILNP